MFGRRYKFYPWLTAAAAAALLATLNLSAWQFDRAAGKRALEDAAAAARDAVAVTLRAAAQTATFQRAALVGEYLPAGEILLDNRVWRGRAGYHVATPFALADGGVVMILRGWLSGDGRRESPPQPPPAAAGRLTVRGIFVADEADAFVLGRDAENGIVRQRLRLADYAAETGLALMSVALIKEQDAAAALPPVSLRINYKSARSEAYAWQWLTFAFLAVVFYVLLSWRKL